MEPRPSHLQAYGFLSVTDIVVLIHNRSTIAVWRWWYLLSERRDDRTRQERVVGWKAV